MTAESGAGRRRPKELVSAELLAFHFAASEETPAPPRSAPLKSFKRSASGKANAASYCLANYRFLVREHFARLAPADNPDKLMDWDKITCVVVSHDEVHRPYPHCAICMEPADCDAAKITKCGHIYCHICLLRHLSYENAANCPICSEVLIERDLKAVAFQQSLQRLVDGHDFAFQLCSVAKRGSICPTAQLESTTSISSFELVPQRQSPNARFSRYTVDSPENVQQRLDAAQAYLLRLHAECEAQQHGDSPDLRYGAEYLPFVASALASLMDERERLTQPPPPPSGVVQKDEASRGTAGGVPTEATLFYQEAASGDPVFLHPMNRKCLLSLVPTPPKQISARVLELEKVVVSEETRKKVSFLRHLPLHAEVTLVEVDLLPLVDAASLQPFMAEIQRRKKARAERARRREKETRAEQHKMRSMVRIAKDKWRDRENSIKDLMSGPVVGRDDSSSSSLELSEVTGVGMVEGVVAPPEQPLPNTSFSVIAQMGGHFPALASAPASSKPVAAAGAWGRPAAASATTAAPDAPQGKQAKFKKGANLFTIASARSYK